MKRDDDEEGTLRELASQTRANAEKLKTLEPMLSHGYAMLARALTGAQTFGVAVARGESLLRRASRLAQQTEAAWLNTTDVDQIARLSHRCEKWCGVTHVCSRMVPILRSMRSQRQPLQSR